MKELNKILFVPLFVLQLNCFGQITKNEIEEILPDKYGIHKILMNLEDMRLVQENVVKIEKNYNEMIFLLERRFRNPPNEKIDPIIYYHLENGKIDSKKVPAMILTFGKSSGVYDHFIYIPSEKRYVRDITAKPDPSRILKTRTASKN